MTPPKTSLIAFSTLVVLLRIALPNFESVMSFLIAGLIGSPKVKVRIKAIKTSASPNAGITANNLLLLCLLLKILSTF